jgi:hypothetical protein
LTFGAIYPSAKIHIVHKTASQQLDNSSTRPHGEKEEGASYHLQSTGEERKEEINSIVQLLTCQYWHKL